MTAPSWTLPTDADEVDDLASVGVHLTGEGEIAWPDAQHAIDATASQLMRSLAKLNADLDRYSQSRADEQKLVTERYERLTAKLAERKARLESWVRQLAESSDFGDKKSRELAWGTYGRRLVPDHLSIADKKKLLSWCHLLAPELITIKQEETLAQKKIETFFRTTGELPDGCEFTAAHDEPFLKLALLQEAGS
jgi:Bacteriophage Mu Gam like protein